MDAALCPWPGRDTELRGLWGQTEPTITTQDMADKMGLTKGQVIGRAHKLELPSRGRRNVPGPQPTKKKPVRKPTNGGQPLPVTAAPVLEDKDEEEFDAAPVELPERRVTISGRFISSTFGGVSNRRMPIMGTTVVTFGRPGAPKPELVFSSVRGCQWPEWPDGERVPRPARYCEATTEFGRSYCGAHCDKVFYSRGR